VTLPLVSSSFVGRVPDVERALELLEGPSRVVTLLGPAGIGKTRLATEIAGASRRKVTFVALEEARSESMLVAAVATALGDSTANVGDALAGRGDVLLVLDNVEQVIAPAAAIVSEWLRAAPRARFVVTSRERLRIEGEACVELAPLERDDAVRLFVERATLARGRFAPTEAERQTIGELGRRLDGNPLAIELAAARTKMFSVTELLSRIDQRFELLTAGPRDRTPRQGSLRGAIDWSWELLGDGEKRTLARCAVFRRGFSVEAAEALLGKDGLLLLESLVDKSLVRRDEERFTIYETVRDYAAEKLAELGDEERMRDAHAAFYASLANLRASELRGAGTLAAVASLRAETDNVLSAHRWLRKKDRAGAATVALSLDTLVAMRGPIDLQRELLDAAVLDAQGDASLGVRALVARASACIVRGDLDAADTDVDAALQTATTDALRAAALEARARVLVDRCRPDQARVAIDEALGLYAVAGDHAGEASALMRSGHIHIEQGQLDAGRVALERALELQRRVDDRVAIVRVLSMLGVVHHWQGRHDEASRCYREALDLARSLDNRPAEATSTLNFALFLLDDGQLAEARALFEHGLEMARASGLRATCCAIVGSLGSIELAEGHHEEARKRFEEALSIARQLGNRRYEAASLRYVGVVLLAERDFDGALRSFEATRVASEDIDTPTLAGVIGATLALLGRHDEAAARFAQARKSLETRGEPRAGVLVEIFEAIAAVARGEIAGARAVAARMRTKKLAAEALVALRVLDSLVMPNLTIGSEARWFRVGAGDQVDLSKRRAPRLILRRLLETRKRAATLEEIVEAGWPGERIQTEAAAARAYTAIKTLRELGLGDILVRRDDGYLLDPAVEIVEAC
jgi:predicted ATPase